MGCEGGVLGYHLPFAALVACEARELAQRRIGQLLVRHARLTQQKLPQVGLARYGQLLTVLHQRARTVGGIHLY